MKQVYFSLLLLLVVGISLLPGGCANPIAPNGGPKDTLAPVLVQAVPKDASLKFNSNKIVLTFDEYVDLQSIQENLLVSPTPKSNPVVESKLRTITIKIKDTLEPNTTYIYNFGNAIKDINEGNVLKNFTYVFSTGATLDSLELRGRVILAQTGKPDSTLIVMLHKKGNDSAVIKERPRFITRLDSSGAFHFRYLPADTFSLYALKDEGGQHRYLSKTQLFAFAGQRIYTGDKNPPITLYAYTEKDEEKKPATPAPAAATQKPKAKDQDKRLHFRTNLQNGELDLLGNLELVFNDPLKRFDSSKALLLDEKFKPLTGYTVTSDSTHKKFSYRYAWKENTAYSMILDKEFAEDSAGKKIPRIDTLKFNTMKESEYGSVRLRFNNLDMARKPVLLLMQGDDIKFSEKIQGKELFKRLFKPGDYEIRILYDTNENGVWDPGQFFGKHIQPEKVQSIKKKMTIKANWDNEVTLEL
ncbi:MAG TPA: Ig-like domain-containing protein [Chitinophagaceae bacterium]|jgi:hypothetical protein